MIKDWQKRHGISDAAIAELRNIIWPQIISVATIGGSGENRVKSQARLDATSQNMILWRNNVGALMDSRGIPVRFGLANDTKDLNSKIKSGDLIGWKRLTITHDMAGDTIAQFVSRECKAPGWQPNYKCRQENAQRAWCALVNQQGGDGKFIS